MGWGGVGCAKVCSEGMGPEGAGQAALLQLASCNDGHEEQVPGGWGRGWGCCRQGAGTPPRGHRALLPKCRAPQLCGSEG